MAAARDVFGAITASDPHAWVAAPPMLDFSSAGDAMPIIGTIETSICAVKTVHMGAILPTQPGMSGARPPHRILRLDGVYKKSKIVAVLAVRAAPDDNRDWCATEGRFVHEYDGIAVTLAEPAPCTPTKAPRMCDAPGAPRKAVRA